MQAVSAGQRAIIWPLIRVRKDVTFMVAGSQVYLDPAAIITIIAF